MKPIDAKQIKLIHVATHQIGMEDDTYRLLLHARFGVKSSKELSYDQAGKLIDELKKLGFKLKSNRPACGLCAPRLRRETLPINVTLMVSPQQMYMIDHLAADVHWKFHDGFARWLKKFYKLTIIKTSIEATHVIEGLKGLLKTQNKCNCRFNGNTANGTMG
jgi:hypothetical protein